MSDGLPRGWEETSLDMVLVDVVGGGTPSRNVPAYYTGKIPWFTVKDLKLLRPDDAQEHITQEAVENSATNVVAANTLVIATRITLGKAVKPKVACAINQDLKALIFHRGMSTDFMLYWVLSNERAIQEMGSGTTVLGIRLEQLRSLPLYLPPSTEQTRIVEKLEELLGGLDAGVAELKAAQRKLTSLRQALLKAAVEGALTQAWRSCPSPCPRSGQGEVGRGLLSSQKSTPPQPSPSPAAKGRELTIASPSPAAKGREQEPAAELLQRILHERRARWEQKQRAKFTAQGKAPPAGWQAKYPEPVAPDTTGLPALPEGWVWATLSQIGWLDRGRSQHRPRNAPHLYGGPYPFIQTGDIRNANTFIRKVDATYSEAGLAQSKLWPVGTMCITIAANIGKTAILEMDACFPDSIVGFIPAAAQIPIRYVEYFMRSAQQKLEDEAPATAQKNINIEILERLCIPLPPLAEQHAILEQLDTALAACDAQQTAITHALNQAAAQRRNLLKAAFAGQLVPQDPADEPASVLLERIRAEREGVSGVNKRGRKSAKSTR